MTLSEEQIRYILIEAYKAGCCCMADEEGNTRHSAAEKWLNTKDNGGTVLAHLLHSAKFPFTGTEGNKCNVHHARRQPFGCNHREIVGEDAFCRARETCIFQIPENFGGVI